jgi:hypothetical protein
MKVRYFIQGGYFTVYGNEATPTGRWYISTGSHGTILYIEFTRTREYMIPDKSYWWDIFGRYTTYKKVKQSNTMFVNSDQVSWWIDYPVQECSSEQD